MSKLKGFFTEKESGELDKEIANLRNKLSSLNESLEYIAFKIEQRLGVDADEFTEIKISSKNINKEKVFDNWIIDWINIPGKKNFSQVKKDYIEAINLGVLNDPDLRCSNIITDGITEDHLNALLNFVKKYTKKSHNYYDPEYRKLRLKVFLRDGEVCGKCKAIPAHGKSLTIDHIKPVSKYPELAMDIDNLQVLCWECNQSKSNKHNTSYRNEGTK